MNIQGDPIDIEFINVTKLYGDVVALDKTNLKIPRGSFHSLLGPSGCGKTTSLRLIAGFEQPTSGDVRHKGVSMVSIPAYKRPVNMVFQHYAPFPHLNVEENISYGPRQRSPKLPKQEIKKQVGELRKSRHCIGLIVDGEDFIWSAHWGGWRITRYYPAGKIEREIRLPVENVTCLGFGGSDLDELYVTTTWSDLSKLERKKQPLAGDLFRIKTDVKGLPKSEFLG